jgi:hypothetical protein
MIDVLTFINMAQEQGFGKSFCKEHLNSVCEKLGIQTAYFSVPQVLLLKQQYCAIWNRLIKQELEKREIKWLVHFTRSENIESILKYGLIPRKKLEYDKIPFVYTDESRWDNHKGICLSITTPNTEMLQKKIQCGYKFTLLLFNANELLLDGSFILPHFYYTNSASEEIRHNKRFNEIDGSYSSVEAFKFMFKERLDVQLSFRKRIKQRTINHAKNDTTDIQAEVVIKKTIPPKYIKKIIPIYLKDLIIKEKLKEKIDKEMQDTVYINELIQHFKER